MHILILGAAGMIGRKLTAAIAAGGLPTNRLTLADVTAPTPPDAIPTTALAVNLANPGIATRLVADRPDLIFHLAAVVSGEAEVDFDKGYAVNLDASRALLEAIRTLPGYHPRLVFASSLAAFGAPFPDLIPDDFHPTPLTSYGTQKAITELLISDYSRRGILDGISLRLPTICIRPGAPNRAASGFFSSILREPLAGLPATLPVPDTTRHWFASARIDTAQIGPRRAVNMPGLSATVAEEIEALRRVAGQKAVDLITRIPDPTIAAIVGNWAGNFAPARATALGFRADASFDDIIRAYLQDDAPGT
ncbi:MAG: D-erythronate dehydrogenase [Pseudomonadota bacterium]